MTVRSRREIQLRAIRAGRIPEIIIDIGSGLIRLGARVGICDPPGHIRIYIGRALIGKQDHSAPHGVTRGRISQLYFRNQVIGPLVIVHICGPLGGRTG